MRCQLGDRLQIVTIDTDKYNQLASQYKIEALPTLVLFQNGQLVDKIEGVLRAKQLMERLQALI
ncbi:MAG: thioredoxin family protein [Hormoscilla sp. SP5CHS1]|nr:thioredoxin family protein [Hormoscilla sp. SP12CHS1]MBC6456039.1 thioredoxin family protein [Hormoscilla sp. SP5CHS1]